MKSAISSRMNLSMLREGVFSNSRSTLPSERSAFSLLRNYLSLTFYYLMSYDNSAGVVTSSIANKQIRFDLYSSSPPLCNTQSDLIVVIQSSAHYTGIFYTDIAVC